MTSNLDCVGLGVDGREGFEGLVAAALPTAVPIGAAGPVQVLRWQDPSGARLVIGLRDNQIISVLPSFAGRVGARFAEVRAANDEVTLADVVDDDGERATALALELEERHLLPAAPGTVAGPACVVGLAVSAAVFADEAVFAASDASLLSGRSADDEPPAHFVENGWEWPPRMAAESFISYGVFDDPAEAQAHARLNGIVTDAERRTVVATGQDFVVARVRTAGFEADVCFAGADCPSTPVAGNVVGGTVFMVGSMSLSVQ